MALRQGSFVCCLSYFALLALFICLKATYTQAVGSLQDLRAAVCGVPQGNFDTTTLSSQNVWSYSTPKSSIYTQSCLKSSRSANVTSCDFLLSFCHAYNCSDADTSLMNTTACITVQEQTGSKTYKLGSYDPNIDQFANDPVDKNSKFLAHFTNGGSYNGTGQNCSLSMDMVFNCDQSLVWQKSTEKKADIAGSALTNVEFGNCKYTLTFKYSGACPPQPPVPPPPGGLSFGSVLLIIFFVGLTIYFVFGSIIIILKYCFGSRGREILPQSEFWTMLPVYVTMVLSSPVPVGKLVGRKIQDMTVYDNAGSVSKSTENNLACKSAFP